MLCGTAKKINKFKKSPLKKKKKENGNFLFTSKVNKINVNLNTSFLISSGGLQCQVSSPRWQQGFPGSSWLRWRPPGNSSERWELSSECSGRVDGEVSRRPSLACLLLLLQTLQPGLGHMPTLQPGGGGVGG